MPIHDQGYRRYGGRRAAVGGAWLVIARQHILPMLRQRRFLLVLLVAWVPFVIRGVLLYIGATVQQASFLAASSQMFRDFLRQQSVFVFLVTIALAGLIADDRRANALQLYLSKPLTRAEYIIGKLATLLVFLLGVTFAPAILLLLLQVLFAGGVTFLRANLFLIPAIVLYSVLEALLSATVLLALSSLSNSRRFVSIMYAGMIFFTAAMARALRGVTGSEAWAWISPTDTLGVVGDTIFRIGNVRPAIPPAVAIAVVIVMIVASLAILERRVRGVEVVT